MAYKASISKAWKSVAKHGTHEGMEKGKAVETAENETDHSHQQVVIDGELKLHTKNADGVTMGEYSKEWKGPITDEYPKGMPYDIWIKQPGNKDKEKISLEQFEIPEAGTQYIEPISSFTEGSSGEKKITTTTGGLVDAPYKYQVRQQGQISNKQRRLDDKEIKKSTKAINKLIKRGVNIEQEVANDNSRVTELLEKSGGYNMGGKRRGDWASTTGEWGSSGKENDPLTTDIDESKLAGINQQTSIQKSRASGHSVNPYNLNPGQYGVQYDKYGKQKEHTTTVPDSSKDVAGTQSDSTIYNKEIHGDKPTGTWNNVTQQFDEIIDVNDEGKNISSLSGYDGGIGVGGDDIRSMATRKGKTVARRGKHAKSKYSQKGPNWHNS